MYNYKGYSFMFAGDENVKDKYIRNYEYFSEMLGFNFPKTNIPYINAKGLAYGKSLDTLTQVFYNLQSYEGIAPEQKGLYHKISIYNQIAKDASTLNVYLRKIKKLMELEEKYRDKNGNIHYNIIYYKERI